MLFIKTKSSGRFGSRSRLTTVHAAPARWRLARNFRGQRQTRSRAQGSGSVLRSSARRLLFSRIWIRSPCLEVKEAELQTETAPSARKVSLIATEEESRTSVKVFLYFLASCGHAALTLRPPPLLTPVSGLALIATASRGTFKGGNSAQILQEVVSVWQFYCLCLSDALHLERVS